MDDWRPPRGSTFRELMMACIAEGGGMKRYWKTRPWWILVALTVLWSVYFMSGRFGLPGCSLSEAQATLLHTHTGRSLLHDLEAAGAQVLVQEGPLPWRWQGYYQGGTITLSDRWLYRHQACSLRAAALAHEYQHALDDARGLPLSEERAFARASEVQYSPRWVQELLIQVAY